MTQTLAPVLPTERLLLRGHGVEDHLPLTRMRNHPDVYRHISGKESSPEENWRKLMASVGHWVLNSFGYWVIEEKKSGDVVGEVGFGNFQRQMTPSLEGTLEAGWSLHPDYHGKGYASEGLKAVLGWAETSFPEKKITCIITPENLVSIRLAQRHGFEEVERTTYGEDPTLVMEWRGLPA